MKLVRKREIATFVKNFEVFAQFDGEKYYLVIETVEPKGTITIMKYEDWFTYHRVNDLFSDIKETSVDIDTLKNLIWQYRKAINEYLKVTVQ